MYLLNGLFSILALTTFPSRTRRLFYTIKHYSKQSDEMTKSKVQHLIVEVSLLLLNCVCQFMVLMLLYSGFGSSPVFIVFICLAFFFAIAAPVYVFWASKVQYTVRSQQWWTASYVIDYLTIIFMALLGLIFSPMMPLQIGPFLLNDPSISGLYQAVFGSTQVTVIACLSVILTSFADVFACCDNPFDCNSNSSCHSG